MKKEQKMGKTEKKKEGGEDETKGELRTASR